MFVYSNTKGQMIRFVPDEKVTNFDVLEGQKTGPLAPRSHLGTKVFGALVKKHSEKHNTRTRKDKTALSLRLLNEILGQGGRFLSWNPSFREPFRKTDGTVVEAWRIVPKKKAREKIAAAIKNQVASSKKQRVTHSQPNRRKQSAEVSSPPHFESVFQFQQAFLETQNLCDEPAERSPQFDVFTGKGNRPLLSQYFGNRIFVALVKANVKAYKTTDCRIQKKYIVESIFYAINQYLGGRFLNCKGDDIIEQDKHMTLKKIAQACRDADKYKRIREQTISGNSEETVATNHSTKVDLACRLT